MFMCVSVFVRIDVLMMFRGVMGWMGYDGVVVLFVFTFKIVTAQMYDGKKMVVRRIYAYDILVKYSVCVCLLCARQKCVECPSMMMCVCKMFELALCLLYIFRVGLSGFSFGS